MSEKNYYNKMEQLKKDYEMGRISKEEYETKSDELFRYWIAYEAFKVED